MYGYIYETTNNVNNKKYIGKKTSSIFIENYFGSGLLIREAIKKYGIENFIVKMIKSCETNEELNESERFYISHFNAYKSNQYYNIAAGGEGGNTYAGKTEEEMNDIRLKISIKNSGFNNGNKGQYIGKLNSMYGKKQSDDARRKISESLKKRDFNHSHPWMQESEIKRQNHFKRYCYLWEIIDKETNQIINNFTHKAIFIKSIYPEVYKKLDRFNLRTLKRDGTIEIDNIKINISLIDMDNINNDLLNKYKQYHKDWKSFIYERRKQYLKDLRKSTKV